MQTGIELMIGSKVYCPVTKRNGTLVAIEMGYRPIVDTGINEPFTESYSGFDCIEGIPLTPEILEMCGFKHGMVEGVTRLRDADDFSEDEGDTHYWDLRVPKNDKVEGLSTFNLVKFGDSDLTFSCQWLRVKLYYLHELQSLYFCLTGMQLNVQLSEPKVE